MNKEQIKDIIVQIVKSCNGCKATDIPLKLVEYVERDAGSVSEAMSHDLIGCINECVEDGRLTEFEFKSERGFVSFLHVSDAFSFSAKCGRIGYKLVAYRRH